MLTTEQTKVLTKLKRSPAKIGQMLGFVLLGALHNEWIKDMVFGKEDTTLQAHRGSYKTTCVSVALALIILIFPNDKTLFMRKTNTDVIEIITQVKKIIRSDLWRILSKKLWGVEIEIIVDRADCITTNLAANDPRGTPQLLAMGLGSSITGKHFDRIFTDDIVNVDDRTSKAEREKTKVAYQELQNIKNRGGRIYNTGTPWHEDDAFQLMPNPKKYDCYSTGLISEEELERIKSKMVASLFAANYELRHIAADDVIFPNPKKGYETHFVEQGLCHVDAAFYGEDYTAFTVCAKHDGNYYIYGRCWRKHIDDCMNDIIKLRKELNAGTIYMETNADKGMVAKEFRTKGERVSTYHERTNKFIKITSYLKTAWENVYFVAGTDEEYLNQIERFTEDADHDDAPDSAASIIRVLWKRSERHSEEASYLL